MPKSLLRNLVCDGSEGEELKLSTSRPVFTRKPTSGRPVRTSAFGPGPDLSAQHIRRLKRPYSIASSAVANSDVRANGSNAAAAWRYGK
jgi:hypothetical protein